MSLEQLKEEVSQLTGLCSDMLSLSQSGLCLENLLGLEENSQVFVSVPLLGGKRKKKVYSTKKKNKHKHKKEKLATLKLYKVTPTEIIRNRKVCPMSPECGPGVFMSKHYDRYYCGRCQLTLKLDPETIKANKAAMEAKKAAAPLVEEKKEAAR